MENEPLRVIAGFVRLLQKRYRGKLDEDADRFIVEVSAERVNGAWHFSVEDNGDGVAPRQAERVFEMFQRMHDRSHPGTGIGLAICKRIVEKHGGRIWVEPAGTGGSAFRFTIPVEGPRS